MDTKAILTGGIVLLTAVILGWFYVERLRDEDPYQDRKLLKKGEDLPRIWVYVNNSDVNARSWADFQARSSRALNLPFLNLCYQSIVKANSELYRIEVIGGLQDLAIRFGGWEALPEPLRNAQTVVREPELTWIRAAVLARWGGVWMSPATVCLRPLGELPEDKVVFFGADPETTFGAAVPALNIVWSPCAMHPLWVAWESRARARLERRSGGSEFRRDQMSDLVDLAGTYVEDVEMRPYAEASRKGPSQRRIQLEDLLAAGSEGDLPFEIGGSAVALPIPYPEILEREAFGWFLRMSEDQILESDLAISHVFRAVL
jgi:hypothetical protein